LPDKIENQAVMNPIKPLVYSLTATNKDPENYYGDIDRFGNYLLGEMEKRYGALGDRLTTFIKNSRPEETQPREIYLFEALMLGVFWNVYGGFAAGTGKKAAGLMKHAALLRRQGGLRRKVADTLRGVVAYKLLEKPENGNYFLFPDTDGLKKLISWMEATGEFHREAKRFSTWLEFFESESKTYTFINICILRGFAAWFKTESLLILGPYTVGVSTFIRKVQQGYKFREDKISVNRQRIEYHLNMLGAFVYNRAMRPEFMKCEERIVLLPACMKAHPADKCKAATGGFGERCTGCRSSCPVNKIRLLGQKYDFDVEIVSHSSELSVSKTSTPAGTGYIGVACAATVIAGGLELRDKGIPAQCVMLNHCGCRHWNREPITTSLNINELLYRAGITEKANEQPINEEAFEPEIIAA
jgi:uncharacterized protein